MNPTVLSIVGGLSFGSALALLAYRRNQQAVRWLAASPGNDQPSLAVVIATRNEESVIENTLRQLCAALPPAQMRVLVVDQSSDATPQILAGLSDEFPHLAFFHKPSLRGKPAALNLALEHVTEDLVLFLDADARVDGRFLREYPRLFSDPRLCAVFADYESYNTQRSIAVVFQDFLFSFTKAFIYSGLFWQPTFATCGLFVRREVFSKVGSFDPNSLVDDLDLGTRMAALGLRAEFVRGPRCKIQYAATFGDLFHQSCRWYTGGIKTLLAGIRRGRLSYVPVVAGSALTVFFPAVLVGVGLAAPRAFPITVGTVLPGMLSSLYGASVLAYLLHHSPKKGGEVLINVVLALPVWFILHQTALLVSLLRAFRRNVDWYKVRREPA